MSTLKVKELIDVLNAGEVKLFRNYLDSKLINSSEQMGKLFETLLIDKDIQILIQQKSTLMGEAGNQEWIYMIQKNPQK